MTEALFAEFAPTTRDEWIKAVSQSIQGGAVESLRKRSYEGFDIQPLPHADDLAGCHHHRSLPGQFPFVRGSKASGYRAQPWLIAQAFEIADPRAFNQTLQEALAGGQSTITVDDELRLETTDGIRQAFVDIDLKRFPLLIQSAARAPALYGMLANALDSETLAQLRGCAGYDPLGGLALTGALPEDAFERLAAHVESVARQSPKLGSIAVNSAPYHDAGANAVQELAVLLATAVTTFRELNARGVAAKEAAPRLHFFMRIGEDFFIEIAKFRAIKLLWAQALRALGLERFARNMSVHAQSGRRNKARLDAHVNMLRLTTEALSAAIGGVDSICLSPFDQPLGAADDFARRLARNLQLILQEELRLTELIDPAGGAWHVEKPTDQLARAAWRRFQAFEADGGLLASLKAGALQAEIAAVAQRRQRDLETGDAILVGCNRYVNRDETAPAAQPATDHRLASPPLGASHTVDPLKPLRLAEPFETLRNDSGGGA
ncbi:MAG: methylmalonyl-CoA mutase family protein [Chloroflexi bacterium]|nr:methylmalonyl-CoA mutase family protein [Chloroflexota bacterium]